MPDFRLARDRARSCRSSSSPMACCSGSSINSRNRSWNSARGRTDLDWCWPGTLPARTGAASRCWPKPGGSTLRLLNLDGKERVIKPEW